MVSSAASTVDQYLASLPPERRTAIARLRDVVNARLPRGYEEVMQYGTISWIVPASRLAETYNGQPLAVACLASQKHHMSLYLMAVYGDAKLATWFKAAFKAAGKKLDMGKSCVRFKAVDALPLDVIGEAVSRVPVDAYVARYEASRSKKVRPRPVGQTKRPKRPAAKASPAKRVGKPATPAAARRKASPGKRAR